ncbi:MAG: class I SAM-dependent methyltransferase [Bacteroidetes bacterium]|nr:class I SAM-dependent methyltransferase [Bacteroidota bacterium]
MEKVNFVDLFLNRVTINRNFISVLDPNKLDLGKDQLQTSDIFSDKWIEAEGYHNIKQLYNFQFNWFLSLYGFQSEDDLKAYLSSKKIILDTGCGLGYKAAWLARLAPHAIVLGVDLSESIYLAAKNFIDIPNLFFFKGDIASTGLKEGVIDFTVCDQVIMHTEEPENTFEHLSRLTTKGGDFLCYVYSKKALPRELIDDYFRKETHNIPKEKIWELSEQLTILGKNLSELKATFSCPSIPLLGIKGGDYDVQRFIYWNFLKCFWKEDWGFNLSKSTNFDWYAPSNAKRFTKDEFLKMASDNSLSVSFLHEEEACYSGRFKK